MDPKVEILKMNVQKKGHVARRHRPRVTFDESTRRHFPGMKVIEGPKATSRVPPKEVQGGGICSRSIT